MDWTDEACTRMSLHDEKHTYTVMKRRVEAETSITSVQPRYLEQPDDEI
jgi:hypothetical protein